MWAQRGHGGCTSAGTDTQIGGTVRARVRHVRDRGGGGAQSTRCRVKGRVSVQLGEGGIDRREKNSSPRCTVITILHQNFIKSN